MFLGDVVLTPAQSFSSLFQDPKTKRWYEVGDAVAREKVGQQIRDFLCGKTKVPPQSKQAKQVKQPATATTNSPPCTSSTTAQLPPPQVSITSVAPNLAEFAQLKPAFLSEDRSFHHEYPLDVEERNSGGEQQSSSAMADYEEDMSQTPQHVAVDVDWEPFDFKDTFTAV